MFNSLPYTTFCIYWAWDRYKDTGLYPVKAKVEKNKFYVYVFVHLSIPPSLFF